MGRRNRPGAALILLALTATMVLSACSAGAEPDRDGGAGPTTTIEPTSVTPAPDVPPGGFEVTTRTETLVDASRPTADIPETGVAPAADRTLVTTFTYPEGDGPFPLIAFAHGHNGTATKFSQLFEAWAAAGFVVAAPDFPLSNSAVPGVASILDLASQPGDLSFVISSALRMGGEPGSFLQGKVNPEQIGAAGLSLGGATVYGVAFNDCCTDERVDAAIVMDGARLAVGGRSTLDNTTPLMIMHADRDPTLPYSEAQAAFAAASPPKYLVTIHEVVHPQPYEDYPDPADDLVIDTTIAFWRLYLTHDTSAAADLSASARVANLTTVVEVPG